MRCPVGFLALLGSAYFRPANALAPTDEYRDADVEQSGYLTNHNMDPAIVDSATFGQLWKVAFNYQEQFYAKPLTYTPLNSDVQLLFMASSQNWIRTLNAETGALILERQVDDPFLQSDIGCTDIPNYIGIIGTPVIDPSTDIAYFFAKTYIPNYRVPGDTGVSNGVYYFYAVDVNTLEDVYPPILIDGTFADNAPEKYFVGGVVLQRPSLTQVGSVVYGAFGGHCDLFNYTGLVIGIDIVQAKIVTQWSVESGPLVPQTNNLLEDDAGGQGGIWMSGMSLASDGERIFVVSGNGDGHENNGAAAAGSSGCQTLGEAAINLAIDSDTGMLSPSDYFQPYDYENMDAADQDFGSGGIVLLDPATFSGGGIEKMAVTAGKNGKIYILDADDLGGYKLGPDETDGVLQTITTDEAVFGASGSYPLEGGFIYLTPVGYPTYVYSLGFTSEGLPQFSRIAQSNEVSAGRVGVGIPTVTSLNGQPGTAILWLTDPDAGIRAWYAVPQNGELRTIPMPQIGGANKFQRPAFGDGRVYTTDSNGILYCLGSPVNLPLNCTSPVDFGDVALGTTKTKEITCTAIVAIDLVVGLTVGDEFFQASNASLPTGPLKAGSTFTLSVTWNLTNVEVTNSPNASYGNTSPGIKSSPLTLITSNGVAGYATLFPVSLTGTEVSTQPFLEITPTTVDYGGVVVMNSTNITVSDVITISNEGLTALTILGYAYTTDDIDDEPNFTNTTLVNGVWVLGYGFAAANLPEIGSQIGPNTAISIDSTFDPLNGTGSYNSYWQVWSTGGTVNIILEGIASTAPVANFSISDGEGGWLPSSNLLMDFGDVAPGSSSSLVIRICNAGGSALEIDKSKPPNGVFHISDPTELHESQQIPPTDCAYGTVLMVANTEQHNVPNLVLNNTWTLNTNDLTFGVHVVEIVGTVVSNKVGPVNSTGEMVYLYLGCFHEAFSGPRLLPNEPLGPNNNNSNGNCMTACYGADKYVFAGTEYADECWCGSVPPPLANQALDEYCNMACPGDPSYACGGTGYISVFYDPTKYTAGADPSLYGPQTVQKVANYSYLGCYSEATNGRALSALVPPAPASGFTIESCEAACQGYILFGMEYSNECYCGNTLSAGSVNQTSSVPSVNGCEMLCTGNSLEYCGGPDRLDVYIHNGAAIPTTPIISTISTSSSVISINAGESTSSTGKTATANFTTSSSFSNPTSTAALSPAWTGTLEPGQKILSWQYLGCANEIAGRALTGSSYSSTTAMTIEACQAFCTTENYALAGVEYSSQCYCSNTLASTSSVGYNGCTFTCSGNTAETCGGSGALSLFNNTAYIYPSNPQLVNYYFYLGCYHEGATSRLLSGASYSNSTGMTVESCTAFCQANMPNGIYAGVEYGQECYCATSLPSNAVLEADVGHSTCNMLCKGNDHEFCGAGNLLNVYEYRSNQTTTVPASNVVQMKKFKRRWE